MHPICVYCGGLSCTCLDTDEEYEAARAEHALPPSPIDLDAQEGE